MKRATRPNQLNIRVSADTLRDIDRVSKRIEAEYGAPVPRSTVVLMALAVGLRRLGGNRA